MTDIPGNSIFRSSLAAAASQGSAPAAEPAMDERTQEIVRQLRRRGTNAKAGSALLKKTSEQANTALPNIDKNISDDSVKNSEEKLP